MAKNDNIKDFCKDVADAIRAKKGTTDLINPQDFSAEIASIEGGGSGGGESNIEYLDVSGFPAEIAEPLFVPFSILAKYSTELGTVIMTPFLTQNISIEKQFKAVMIDFTMQVVEMGQIGTIKEVFIVQGFTQEDLDTIPRLTKEQFYSLE